MVWSPCCLRSAQCAALIALAAVAGASRVALAGGVTPELKCQPVSAPSADVTNEVPTATGSAFWTFGHAGWMWIGFWGTEGLPEHSPRAGNGHSAALAYASEIVGDRPFRHPPASSVLLPFLTREIASPNRRGHRLPFAHGPPAGRSGRTWLVVGPRPGAPRFSPDRSVFASSLTSST
jgi:hypothetical protein